MRHMNRCRMLLPAVVAAATLGCYESDFPLDSAPVVPVEAALRGTWRCLPSNGDADEPPATMVVDVPSERTYGITWQESGSPAEHYDAYGSSVGLPRLLNVHEASGKWVFVRYDLIRPSVLQLQVVQDGVADKTANTPALRTAIEALRTKPDLLADFCVCVRAKGR
jgi:hypothetical protein